MPGFSLSDLGRQMAQRVADTIGDRDIVRVVASPLERAQQTAAPLANALGLDIVADPRVIESSSVFEGQRFGVGQGVLRKPSSWRYLWNPLRPSWGVPYNQSVRRVTAAIEAARLGPVGHESGVVSSPAPLWITPLFLEPPPVIH